MKKLVLLIVFMIGCAETRTLVREVACDVSKTDGVTTIKCPNGTTATITDGLNSFIDVIPADKSVCLNGGSNFIVYQDLNRNGLREDTDIVTSVSAVCNGESATLKIALADITQCKNGGYVFETTPPQNTVAVCNGEDGPRGLQGIPGTVISPIKFCINDNSAYPEYGLIINGEIYAVYWGSTPSSTKAQAFLTKVTPGAYQSTGGNGCYFTVE